MLWLGGAGPCLPRPRSTFVRTKTDHVTRRAWVRHQPPLCTICPEVAALPPLHTLLRVRVSVGMSLCGSVAPCPAVIVHTARCAWCGLRARAFVCVHLLRVSLSQILLFSQYLSCPSRGPRSRRLGSMNHDPGHHVERTRDTQHRGADAPHAGTRARLTRTWTWVRRRRRRHAASSNRGGR